MKNFQQWMEANAKLYGASEHPRYGEPPVNQPTSAPAPAEPPAPRKLDTNQSPQAVVNQYLSAFGRRLDDGNLSDLQAQEMIEFNVKQIASRFGKQAAEFFRDKASFKLKNYRDYQAAMAKKDSTRGTRGL
jgi:hypothetical protein